MRIAVLANGQLGRDLVPRLSGEVHALGRDQVDLTDSRTLADALIALQPDVVVNCAAYNFVDRAESEPHAAFAVNTWGVHALAQVCHDLGARLVHFSTDYVFGLDADRREPWTESDVPGPVSVYGLSKLNGEYLVRAICPRHAVIRTCGLYGVWGSGGKGGNFVETMLRLAHQGRSIRVVADQVCTPSYTVDVAQATAHLIAAQGQGLFHLTNSGSCSWYELASEVFRQSGLTVDVTAITSAEYAAAARRPTFSVLSNHRAVELGVSPLRPWTDALADYLRERQQRA